MSENLFKAIYTFYKASPANSFYTATGGQLEYSKAPESWDDNFAVIQGVDSNPDDCFRIDIDDFYFQINVFSTTRNGCWSLLEKCRALFDNAKISPTGHYQTMLHRGQQVSPLWNEEDELWQATIEFRCKLQPT
jgi:hypothetical protein